MSEKSSLWFQENKNFSYGSPVKANMVNSSVGLLNELQYRHDKEQCKSRPRTNRKDKLQMEPGKITDNGSKGTIIFVALGMKR